MTADAEEKPKSAAYLAMKAQFDAADERGKKILIARAMVAQKNRRERDKHAAPGGLLHFVRYFWSILEPATPMVEGWAMEAICLHLEAVTDGKINRLLINVPPGFAKSLISNVFWPLWEWVARDKFSFRYLTFSYASHNTERDNRRFLSLIQCQRFQELYGSKFKLQKAGEVLISNDKTGWKLAASIGGLGTGERGDRVILDDPHHVREAESEVIRTNTVTWFREAMSNRLNDAVKSAVVVIMQRVHECLLPSTLVSSPMGTIRADDIKAGDDILTTHGIQKVVAVASRPYVGRVIGITVYGSPNPIWVTPNHPILTTSGWVEAGELKKETRLALPLCKSRILTEEEMLDRWPLPAEKKPIKLFHKTFNASRSRSKVPKDELAALIDQGKTSTEMAEHFGLCNRQYLDLFIAQYGLTRQRERTVESDIVIDEGFWRLVGYWLAEGSLTKGRHELTHIRLTFNENEKSFIDDAISILKSHGIPATVHRKQSSTVDVFFCSRQMGSFLSEFGRGATNKRLPEWVINIDRKYIEQMFLGYWRGDGSSIGKIARVSSTSLALMTSFQRALLRHGIVANVCGKPSREVRVSVIQSGPGKGRSIRTGVSPKYEIRVHFSDVPFLGVHSAPPTWKASVIADNHLSLKIRKLEEKTYSGYVYDLETPCHDFLCGQLVAHNCDVSGTIREDKLPYCILNIPMMYDGRDMVNGVKQPTAIGWVDPRTKDGELAWPERYPQIALQEYISRPYMWASQYMQTPEPRGGAIIKREYWKKWERPNYPSGISYIVASADTAYTEKESNDPSALTIWGLFEVDAQPHLFLMYAWRKRLELHGLDTDRKPGENEPDWIARTQHRWGLCEWLGYSCKRFKVHKLIIEGKASGLSVAQELRRLYRGQGWSIETVTPEGDKVARAHAAVSTFTDGLVYAPDKIYARTVIDETAMFPRGRYKDLTDTVTQGIKHFRDNGLLLRRTEKARYDDEERRTNHHPEPLYPV